MNSSTVFFIIVGLLVATAAGIFIYEKVQYNIDKERLPGLKREYYQLSDRFDGPNDFRTPLKPGESESALRKRMQDLSSEIDVIQKRHPDLARH